MFNPTPFPKIKHIEPGFYEIKYNDGNLHKLFLFKNQVYSWQIPPKDRTEGIWYWNPITRLLLLKSEFYHSDNTLWKTKETLPSYFGIFIKKQLF